MERIVLRTAPVGISRTIATRTADIIRQRILSVTPGYEPGVRLYPQAISQDLGVSSTPVREALMQLVAEGVVSLTPRRGFSVIYLTPEELDDLVSVRAGLEVMALRFRGGRLLPEEVLRLDACLDACERALRDRDLEACRANDVEFHRLLVVFAHSPRLLTLYETLLNTARMVEIYSPRYTESLGDALKEHRQLARQFKTGDPAKSEQALLGHWERSRDRVHRKYAELPSAARPRRRSLA
jgi:DNA-binding GntR family transcriptional regulator